MLAARDFAKRRDRLRLFIMRHRYVGDESRSAANISANLRILPGGSCPSVELCERDILSVTILMAFSRSAARDLLCRTWGSRDLGENISLMQIAPYRVVFSKMLIDVSRGLQSGRRLRCIPAKVSLRDRPFFDGDVSWKFRENKHQPDTK